MKYVSRAISELDQLESGLQEWLNHYSYFYLYHLFVIS